MVEVTHGPLRSVIGRLMRKDVSKARLVLAVNLIGQAVTVEVDAGGRQDLLTRALRRVAIGGRGRLRAARKPSEVGGRAAQAGRS